MAATGVSRSTLKKALAWLRSRGFLGIVASGRKGMYAQKGSDGHELWPSTTGERTNERAVYVLCRPLTEAEKAALESTATATVLVAADGDKLTVDISRPPIPTSVGNNPPHAREGLCEVKNDGATPRQTPKAALSERGQDSCASRPQPLWDIHGTTKAGTKRATRANELVAALTLRDRNFKLRALSGRHLAYLCRPLFAAGYTVWDIEQIIDRKPDGSLHRHDGLDGAKNLANLVAYRFGHWIVNGIPVYSPTQRIMKRREEPLKRAIAAAREAKRVVKPQVTGWSDRAVRIIADIRAMFK